MYTRTSSASIKAMTIWNCCVSEPTVDMTTPSNTWHTDDLQVTVTLDWRNGEINVLCFQCCQIACRYIHATLKLEKSWQTCTACFYCHIVFNKVSINFLYSWIDRQIKIQQHLVKVQCISLLKVQSCLKETTVQQSQIVIIKSFKRQFFLSFKSMI